MGNKIQKIYVGNELVYPKKILVFDFKNNGQQNRGNLTGFGSSYGGFTTGEGFYLRRKVVNPQEAGFTTMPSGLPSGTLTKIKIRFYLPNSNTGVGINDNGSVSSCYNWGASSYTLGFGNSTPASIGNYTGELVTEYNITPTACSGICAGVPFSFTTTEANNFITAYNNGTLRLYLVQWNSNDNCYLRKVELTIIPD